MAKKRADWKKYTEVYTDVSRDDFVRLAREALRGFDFSIPSQRRLSPEERAAYDAAVRAALGETSDE